ncbi:hypothetical protein AgCh_033591 [Apium graveolens]
MDLLLLDPIHKGERPQHREKARPVTKERKAWDHLSCNLGDALSVKSRSRGRALGLCGWASSADIPKASRRRFPVGFLLGLGIKNLSPLDLVSGYKPQTLLLPNSSVNTYYGIIDACCVVLLTLMSTIYVMKINTNRRGVEAQVGGEPELPCLGTRKVISKEFIEDGRGRKFEKLHLGEYQWETYGQIYDPEDSVTIYASLGEEALIHSLNETEVSTLICDYKLLKKLSAVRLKLQTVKNVIYFDDGEAAVDSKL